MSLNENETVLKSCPLCGASGPRHERIIRGHELVRCADCGFVHANITQAQVAEINANYSDQRVAIYAGMQSVVDVLWFRRVVQTLNRLVGPVSGRSVLDVGCGNGVLLKAFMDEGWAAHGVDLSPWADRFAKEYGYALHKGELEKCDIAPDSFDAVTSTSTLEHIPRPVEHVRAILRVVTPGGFAVFTGIPNYNSWGVRFHLASFRANSPPDHVNYFTCRTMRKLLSDPEIAQMSGKTTIRSYGVPEIHRLYRFVVRGWRKMRGKGTGQKSADVPRPAAGRGRKPVRDALLRLVVATVYHAGRPGGVGDKVEVVVQKR